MTISSGGPDSGIIWSSMPLGFTQGNAVVPGALRDEGPGRRRDFVRDAWPTVANGKVYEPSQSNAVHVYGLLR